MKIETTSFRTNMGKISDGGNFYYLTAIEMEALNEIGYSGKLKGKKTTYEEYLNSLGKGEFQVTQTKTDNGNFKEAFTLVRVVPEEKKPTVITFGATGRGFGLGEFSDSNGAKCSIQMSSSAEEAKIWLGIDDANPLIMASDAIRLGLPTTQRFGWIPYPIPQEVLLSTRMHLTIEDVKALLPILQHFVETGELT